MGEEHRGVNKDVSVEGRITIPQASTLLGVHPNTVRKRVKAGIYEAEKVSTENGFTWMIDRNSLINTPLPNASQYNPLQEVNPRNATPTEMVRDLLRPFVEDLGRVREELGAERVLREQAEQERDELRRRLESLQERRDAPETATEGETSTETPASDAEQPRASWWRRFFGG